MLKIRLQRVGRKHDPSFRVVLVDSRRGPKSGDFIENLGFYDTIRKIKQIKGDRVKHWLGNGAQPSDTVYNLLVSEKIIEGKKKNVLPRKSPIIDEEKIKAEQEAVEKAKTEAEAKVEAENEVKVEEEIIEETSTEEKTRKDTEDVTENPVEEIKEEKEEEAPTEEEKKD